MDWRMDDRGFPGRVSPFRDPRINGYLLLPVAYRSLSRLSSALSAKASTLRPYQLDHLLMAQIHLHLSDVSDILFFSVWRIALPHTASFFRIVSLN